MALNISWISQSYTINKIADATVNITYNTTDSRKVTIKIGSATYYTESGYSIGTRTATFSVPLNWGGSVNLWAATPAGALQVTGKYFYVVWFDAIRKTSVGPPVIWDITLGNAPAQSPTDGYLSWLSVYSTVNVRLKIEYAIGVFTNANDITASWMPFCEELSTSLGWHNLYNGANWNQILTPGVNYTLRIQAIDVDGVEGGTSLNTWYLKSFQVANFIPPTPIVFNITKTFLAITGVLRTRFEWSTAPVPTTTILRIDGNSVTPAYYDGAYSTSHIAYVDGLSFGATHTFQLCGYSEYGLFGSSAGTPFYQEFLTPSELPTTGRPKIYSITASVDNSILNPGKKIATIGFLTDLACDTRVEVVNKLDSSVVDSYIDSFYTTTHTYTYDGLDLLTNYRVYVSGNNGNPSYGGNEPGYPPINIGCFIDISTEGPGLIAYVRPVLPALGISSNIEANKRINSYWADANNYISVSGIPASGYFQYTMEIRDQYFNNIPYNSTYVGEEWRLTPTGVLENDGKTFVLLYNNVVVAKKTMSYGVVSGTHIYIT